MNAFVKVKVACRYFFALTLCFFSLSSQAVEWPQEVDTAEGIIVVYQPQPETLNGNVLVARSAMSFKLKDDEPIFGVFWFNSKIDTDRSADSVTVHHIDVTKVRWPDSKDAGEQRFTTAVNNALKEVQFVTSLSQLTASLESAQAAEKSLSELKNEPPKILFADKLAVLLSFDGKPKFSAIDNSPYERALNTPMTVVRDSKTNTVYLTSGTTWYQAKDVMGPYSETKTPPADLVKIVPKPEQSTSATSQVPQIVVATEPTELIVTDGTANWKSLTGGELMYVNNTETPWLRELKTSNMYVLLSGRWYRAKKQTGPWTFVKADELPSSFANIPPESDLAGLRVSVAGTEEANEAVLDAHIPQTAAISRKDTSLTVTYDGKPKFEKIPGTAVSYAVNTAAQVLLINKKYYAVDNAVWFKADSATGPWKVADEIPKDEIAKIPPSSPVYNTTYVDIYESTPEVVYVGYYPGYMWSYPYHGVPVYGTGWYYPPYWGGGYYYPRPPTWGFNVGYNPWTGWNFGLSWSNGFFSVGIGWSAGYPGGYRPGGHCCNGWYGGGYRPPVIINTGDINIGNKVNIGNHNNINIGSNNRTNNLYKRGDNIKRNAAPSQVKRDFKTARSNRDAKNNVFADKQGNVLKNNGDSWQQRSQNKWQELDSAKQQQIKSKASNIDRQQLKDRASTVDRDKARSTLQNSQVQQRARSLSDQRMQQLNNANRARQQGFQRQQQLRQTPRQLPRRGH
ncbi:carbohydrate-binding family V/XII [Pseudoalteromonas shioyasakiensis]|uniref:carbohydrate-binding family V/XII n=1 Tax=Pseudoalteromonas shioyasakiensis TaxID=1190813 RepID=UPI00211759D9|nr:carbohydrate-binding family V/XII [Pseudoalteromonas shioyasakiensis]MCQ8878569.1 carbohydrate-binding family V/XII [Pseudoalteromonas shioyasakiensis]